MATKTTKTKFDIRTEAEKGLHAGVGAADMALEAVKEYLAEAQKRFEELQKDAQKRLTAAQKQVKGIELEPKALRTQATTRFEGLSKDAKARRTEIEKRVSELRADARKVVTENVETATGTYDKLAKRGEKVVKKLRKQTAAAAEPGPVKKSTGATVTAKRTPAKKTTKKAPAKTAATTSK